MVSSPAHCFSHSILTPVASITLTAASIMEGPIPSPSINVILYGITGVIV